MFKTIENKPEGIKIEKKSKFIANIFYVENEKEAEEKLNEIRKKYYDARHNCFAYRIKTENGIIQKQSDDGEPSGTAGAPILNILEKQELVNLIAIVTRYFGGILLGTGGLVKAYSEAIKEALQNAIVVEKEEGYLSEIMASYEEANKIEYLLLTKTNAKILNKEYLENVILTFEIPKEEYEKIFVNKSENYFKNIKIKIKKEKTITIKNKL